MEPVFRIQAPMVSAMGRRSRSRDRGPDYGHYNHFNRGGGRDYSSYYRHRFGSQSPEEYQNLRLSYISDGIDDNQLRRILEKEFSRYGDMQAKVLPHSEYGGGGRIAYVNYSLCGPARVAKSRLQDRMIGLLGPKVKIDPAGIIKDQAGRYVNSQSPGRRQGRNRSFDQMADILPPPPSGPRDRTPRGGPPPGRFYDEPFAPRGSRRGDRSRSPLDNSPRRRHLSPDFLDGGRGGGRFGYGDERAYVDLDHDLPERHSGRSRDRRDQDEELNECRTLFVGNLDMNVDHKDLRDLFESYGVVEDVDIKSSQDNHRFAFVQFRNLDMARKAKAAEAGRMLRRTRISIGYAKVKQSKRLWIGGLRGLSIEFLEKELDRFGAIKKIDFLRGENHAYVLFDSLDAAVAAYSDIKGYGICNRRMRVDFASDDISMNGDEPPRRSGSPTRDETGRTRRYSDNSSSEDSFAERNNKSTERSSYKGRPRSPSPAKDHSSSSKKARTSQSVPAARSDPLAALTRHVTSVEEHLLCAEPLLPQVWSGAFVLKRSAYPIHLFHLKGSLSLFARYARNKEANPCPLVVSQRLKLDQPKHEDIPKWIASPDYCFLLAASWGNASPEDVKALALPEEGGGAMQARSLKLLVKYFKDKDAAGVVNLVSSKDAASEPSGMLYAFPACKFADALMSQLTHRVDVLRTCPDEVLLLVLIRGGTG